MRLALGLRQAASLPQSRAEQGSRGASLGVTLPAGSLAHQPDSCGFGPALGTAGFVLVFKWGRGMVLSLKKEIVLRREREGVQWEPLKALNLVRSLPIPESKYLRGARGQLLWEIKK